MTEREKKKYIRAVLRKIKAGKKAKQQCADFLKMQLNDIDSETAEQLPAPNKAAEELSQSIASSEKEIYLKHRKASKTIAIALLSLLALLIVLFAIYQRLHPSVGYVLEESASLVSEEYIKE